MSDTTAHQETAAPIGQAAVDKGKGKAVEERPVEIEDESSDDEMNTCDESLQTEDDVVDDKYEEIDPSNILNKRTRGYNIDFRAAQEDAMDDDEDEDDEDFKEPPEPEDPHGDFMDTK